jgi:hypothetical protein
MRSDLHPHALIIKAGVSFLELIMIKRMAETDEQLFCRYDTPRKTLPEVLDAFQSAHP